MSIVDKVEEDTFITISDFDGIWYGISEQKLQSDYSLLFANDSVNTLMVGFIIVFLKSVFSDRAHMFSQRLYPIHQTFPRQQFCEKIYQTFNISSVNFPCHMVYSVLHVQITFVV